MLQICIKSLTIEAVRKLLSPAMLVEKFNPCKWKMIEIYVTKVFAVIFEEFGVMDEPWQGE